MKAELQEIIKRPYHIQLVRDEDEDGNAGWVASVAELEGCLSQGDTPEEAATRIYDAMEAWVESMLQDGKPIPPPADQSSANGKVLVRMPRSLHERLIFEAEQEGVSLNQYAVAALAGSVSWRGSSLTVQYAIHEASRATAASNS